MSTTTTPTNERLENGYFVNSDGLLFVIVNRHPYRLKPPVNLPGSGEAHTRRSKSRPYSPGTTPTSRIGTHECSGTPRVTTTRSAK